MPPPTVTYMSQFNSYLKMAWGHFTTYDKVLKLLLLPLFSHLYSSHIAANEACGEMFWDQTSRFLMKTFLVILTQNLLATRVFYKAPSSNTMGFRAIIFSCRTKFEHNIDFFLFSCRARGEGGRGLS